MEILNAIILLLSTALPLIAAVITFIAKLIKSDKAKKAAEDLLKINDTIEEYMVKAEKFEGYSGEQKKNYVLRCAKGFALSGGMEFNETNAGEVIENLISFSKSVNKEEGIIEPCVEIQKTKTNKKRVGEKFNEANHKRYKI